MAVDPYEITKFRGDTKPIAFKLWSDKAAGLALDISSYTFKLTVDPEEEPVDGTNNLFSLDGSITSAEDGEFQFEPTALQMDITPGEYYYDLQITDPSGYIETQFVKKFTIKQDITK
jgi:hypothetical protein